MRCALFQLPLPVCSVPEVMDKTNPTLRQRVFRMVEPDAWGGSGVSFFDRSVIAVILIATLLAVVETEGSIVDAYGTQLAWAEAIIATLFILEYVTRFWIAAEHLKDGGGWRSRLKFVLLPASIVDLIVIMTALLPFFGSGVFLLRALRMVRILRLANLGGFSIALATLAEAVGSRRHELLLSLSFSVMLMLFGATAMWLAEGTVQPEKFGSIPRALWWAIVTLTTIGYGDAFPVTPLGKVLAGLVAIAGIGLIALPSGILASAFSEIAHKRRT